MSICNECLPDDGEVVVPCEEPSYINTNCPSPIPLKCSFWSATAIPCVGINPNDNGEVVIGKLATALCNLVDPEASAKVKISSGDTTAGYLFSKLVAGTGIVLTKNNSGGNETITISLNSGALNVPLVMTNTDHSLSIVQSGTSNHTVVLNTVVSPTAGNGISKLSNGLFVAAYDYKVKVSGTDTTPAYLLTKLIAGSGITITQLNIAGNETLRIAYSGTVSNAISILDSTTIDLTGNGLTGSPLTASVKISTAAGNLITVDSEGLKVLSPNSAIVVGDTQSIDLVNTSGTITANAIISTDAGNALSLHSNGLFVTVPTVTIPPIVATDTATIDFTVSGGGGHNISADVKISTYVGNVLTYKSDGLYSNGNLNPGTVTSVDATGGTGISVTGGPITSAGTFTIVNTAPDRTVVLNNGAGISVTGTYPNFTIATTITQYTDALARAAHSLTTTGSSGASTYNSSTGVFNIPVYSLAGLGGVPTGRVITINGTAQDLSADRTWNVGTVTSVGATAGSGISVSGSPITGSGSFTITNTAPDQIVVLSNGTGISVTGTYPNFTIATTITQYTDVLARAAISAGTGISYNSTSGVITNSAPDQTVTLTNGTNITVTGTYPNFTINAAGGGSGTVTSVAATAGTGISVSGSPITTSGTLIITNTAPDQTVTITNGTGISHSGTYPNFTITNTAPDQTVALTAGTNISITGTYPNFTINSTGGGGSQSLQDVCNIGDTTTTDITANAFFESSDKRLKTLILDNPSFDVTSITAKFYIKAGKEELGYFAQDFENVLPSAVKVGINGNLVLSYREVFVAKIASLEKRVKELEDKLGL